MTPTSVGRILGSREAAVVKERFGRRKTATTVELAALAEGLLRYIDTGPLNRVTSRQVRARDVAAVAAMVLTAWPVDRVLQMERSEVHRLAICEHKNPALDQYMKPVLSEAVTCADLLWRSRAGIAEAGPFFVAHRGKGLNLRGPAQALRKAMDGFDDRLPRRPCVFFDVTE